MAYTKPVVVAQNGVSGSFAAGCPAKERGPSKYDKNHSCINCERTQ